VKDRLRPCRENDDDDDDEVNTAMRSKSGDWNVIRQRNFIPIASASLFVSFVLLRFTWNNRALDENIFPYGDERNAGNAIRETHSPVVDYEECPSEPSVLQFADRNHMIRRSVSVQVFESFDGSPARRGLVATEEIAENQVHVLNLLSEPEGVLPDRQCSASL
jgi:hypothetical protein